jgi:Winged helix DNA-binding domain
MVGYGDEPSVLVIYDSEAGEARAREAAQLAGCRIAGSVPLEGAVERLDRQVALGAVLLAIDGDAGGELDRLLDRLQDGAESDRFGSVIAAPLALIDAIASRAWHERISLLCEPSSLQLVSDVALAAVRAPVRLHDVRRENGAGRLQQLSEEVGRIANILASIGAEDSAPSPSRAEADAGPAIEAGQVRAIIRARRLRDQFFSADLFADPAWDMLLDLMAARLERRRVAVSSLCIAAAVPATTALRWIKTMTDHGLFVRAADPQDGRRVYIELSDDAAAGLEAYLRAVQRLSPTAI